MTEHRHSALVPGCYRCDLGRDEVAAGFARVDFDRQPGVAYVYLTPEAVARSIDEVVMVDIDAHRRAVGVEILLRQERDYSELTRDDDFPDVGVRRNRRG